MEGAYLDALQPFEGGFFFFERRTGSGWIHYGSPYLISAPMSNPPPNSVLDPCDRNVHVVVDDSNGVLLAPHPPAMYTYDREVKSNRKAREDSMSRHEAGLVQRMEHWQTAVRTYESRLLFFFRFLIRVAKTQVRLSYEELTGRRGKDTLREIAQEKMEGFERGVESGQVAVYHGSHLVLDKNGKLLVACFAETIVDAPDVMHRAGPPKKKQSNKEFQRRKKEKKVRPFCFVCS